MALSSIDAAHILCRRQFANVLTADNWRLATGNCYTMRATRS
jgi:hypothetical protein